MNFLVMFHLFVECVSVCAFVCSLLLKMNFNDLFIFQFKFDFYAGKLIVQQQKKTARLFVCLFLCFSPPNNSSDYVYAMGMGMLL